MALTRAEFVALLTRMAAGWNSGDAALVAGCFSEDVDYADPLRYHFRSRAELLPFFTLAPGETQQVTWHALVFDPETQTGAAEYSYTGSYRYHGLALVELRDGLVARWREYQHIDERPWEEWMSG